MLQELQSASTSLLLMPTLAVAYRCRLSPQCNSSCMHVYAHIPLNTVLHITRDLGLVCFFVCLFSPRGKQENVLHLRHMQSRKNFFSRSGQVAEMMLIVSCLRLHFVFS